MKQIVIFKNAVTLNTYEDELKNRRNPIKIYQIMI